MDYGETTKNLYQEVLKSEDPGWQMSEALFADGWDQLAKGLQGPQGVAETAAGLGEEAFGQLRIAEQLLARIKDDDRTQRTLQVRNAMSHERSIWRLVATLVELRYTPPTEVSPPTAASTDAEIAEALAARDWDFSLLSALVQWTKANALDLLAPDAGEVPERATLAEEALHQLRSKRPDPAAPFLSLDAKSSDPSDQAAERGLWRAALVLLRCGETERAVEVTRRLGSPAIGGLLASLADFANVAHRRATKRLAWKLLSSRNASSLEASERGAYGLLVGHLPSLLPLCASWEDAVFAHATAAREWRLEEEIARVRGQAPIGEPTDRSVEEVFRLAASSEGGSGAYAELGRTLATSAASVALPAAVLPFLHDSLAAAAEDAPVPRHLLRLYASLTLLLQRLPEYRPEEQALHCDAVLELFVQQLVEDRRAPLIPCFTAALSTQELQTRNFAVWAETLATASERRAALEAAAEAGLETDPICVETIERAIQARRELDTPSSCTPSGAPEGPLVPYETGRVEEEDAALIDCFQWLLLSDSLRLEALRYSNAIVRSFLLQDRGASAAAALLVLPGETYALIRESMGESLAPPHEAVLHQHFALRKFLEAEASFGEWFTAYHAGPDRAPEEVRQEQSFGGADPLVSVALEGRREAAVAAARAKWDVLHASLRQMATASLRQILVYPAGRWLEPTSEASAEEAEEMRKLQRRLLPRVLDMLLHIFKEYHDQEAALELAIPLADSDRRLYELTGPALHKLVTVRPRYPANAH